MKKKEKAEKGKKSSWKPAVLCVLGGFLLYGAAVTSEKNEDIAMGFLKRGGYGEDPAIHEILVEGLREEAMVLSVEVGSRQYSEEESRQVFDRILRELPGLMLGEQPSLLEVRSDLTLPTEFPEEGVTVRWTSENLAVMDHTGRISEDSNGRVWLTAELSDGLHKERGRFEVQVLPRAVTEEQQLEMNLARKIREAEEENREKEMFELPKEYEGVSLTYGKKKEGGYEILPFLGILGGALLAVRSRQKGQEEEKKRERKLLLSYADVVYQLMVFMGAGLSVSMAWERIVLNYNLRRKAGRCPKEPAYEEMSAAYERMQRGVSEGQAIMEFGMRCRLKPYRKLCSVLEQNRKTGTKDLLHILEQEMTDAWEQQKNLAKQLGEEAQTRLLLPLMLMLLVVMAIIMLPAMLSMG